jgi:putative peptidoglycan lipid II flippase
MMQLLSRVGVSPERPNGFGHVGVALATSIVATINFLALAYFMRRRIDRLNGKDMISSLIRIIIASGAMSAAAYFSYVALNGYFGDKLLWVRLAEAFIPMAIAGIVFVIIAKLLRIEELDKAYGALARKLGK